MVLECLLDLIGLGMLVMGHVPLIDHGIALFVRVTAVVQVVPVLLTLKHHFDVVIVLVFDLIELS